MVSYATLVIDKRLLHALALLEQWALEKDNEDWSERLPTLEIIAVVKAFRKAHVEIPDHGEECDQFTCDMQGEGKVNLLNML